MIADKDGDTIDKRIIKCVNLLQNSFNESLINNFAAISQSQVLNIIAFFASERFYKTAIFLIEEDKYTKHEVIDLNQT